MNSLWTVASAIIFFKTGDQVDEVALPICVPFLKIGTARRDAMGDTAGGSAGSKIEFGTRDSRTNGSAAPTAALIIDAYFTQFNQPIKLVHLPNADAPNDSVYYSTDANKVVYKDGGGAVNNLY